MIKNKEFNFNDVREIKNTNTNINFIIEKDSSIIAKADCQITDMRSFLKDIFFKELLLNELSYLTNYVIEYSDKSLKDNMSIHDFTRYILENYEDESQTLEFLYNIYLSLINTCLSNAKDNNSKVVLIDYIEAKKGYGAGTIIVEYLKEHYDLIFLYSLFEAENYWIKQVGFKEILSGYMYWTKNNNIREIL